MREMCWNLPGFALSSCQAWRKSSELWGSLAWLWCVTAAARPALPARQRSRSSGCGFLETGSNPLCICSLDLIWGLNLCCAFHSFLNHTALPSWQENAVFPPHLEVISALGLQWRKKAVLCFYFIFCFLLFYKALCSIIRDSLFPALQRFCCSCSPRH